MNVLSNQRVKRRDPLTRALAKFKSTGSYMSKKDNEVLVVARNMDNLDELSRRDGPLVQFGTRATSIARKVKEGNGKAVISYVDLRIAMDTQDAVNAIFDNFDLYDARTKAPLIYQLLKINDAIAR